MIKKLLITALLAAGTGAAAYAQEDAKGVVDYVETIVVEEPSYTPATDFTLKDLDGKDVSLSQFKGKWVVLDFWGTWCKWCIAGIPEMKKAYEAYHPLGLEIIGIDCGEPEAAWKEGVERFQLPWVNVYNPDSRGSGLLEAYGIQGFPTKVIINPQGEIYETIIGEDPVFYEILKSIFTAN